jgi:putative transposase
VRAINIPRLQPGVKVSSFRLSSRALARNEKDNINQGSRPCQTPFMANVKIWIHCVWATKNHKPFLSANIRQNVLDHIRENAEKKKIRIVLINGVSNHLHCLLLMYADQCIAQIMQLIKGESSFWVNKQRLVTGKFEWADEYYAVSVSEADVERVRNYIRNQEEHHRKKSWDEEVDEFIRNYDFTRYDE